MLHGFVSKPEVSTGPTEIIEISQDLFAKEVYGEQTILDPATGNTWLNHMLWVLKFIITT